ncbi:MAG: glycosyltransferase [Armatimonadota bacterium]
MRMQKGGKREIYPPIVFEHLETLTDSTGVIQHAIFSIPNRRTGYTTDDNSRALIAAIMEFERTHSRSILRLASTYLSFIHYAQTSNGRFHNFMAYDQVWLDTQGSEDCFGRVLWACGYALAADLHPNIKKVAKELFDGAIPWIPVTQSMRARAYMASGCYYYLRYMPESKAVREALTRIADSMCDDFDRVASPEWAWFEDWLTYSNGMMPRALFFAYQLLQREKYLQVACESLDFLTSVCVVDDMLHPIGCNGWYFRGRERAWYDQQPVDPMCHILAYLAAYDTTGKTEYLRLAKISFDWFFGHNSVSEALYDPVTGGCSDALSPQGRNLNEGAESTICCLLAQLSMQPYLEKLKELES